MQTLVDKSKIKESQEQFATTFDSLQPEVIASTLGYQTGSTTRQLLWISSLDVWAHFGRPPSGKSSGPRYWNVFGIGEPASSESIVCEINPPLSGTNRYVAGAFVSDKSNRVWVAHRGKFNVHGGMTMEFFRERYPKPYTIVNDGGEPYEMILIGRLGSPDLPRLLAQFVHEVDRIKDIRRSELS